MKRLEAFLNETHKKTFLDVGTGRGTFVEVINSLYKDYTKIVGIDKLDRAVELATDAFNDSRIKFKKMDALDMLFDDDTFDVVCLSNSLHHTNQLNTLLSEMTRVCKKDGYIIISEMVSDDLNKKQQSHKLFHHFAAKIDRILGDTHNDTYTKQEILELVDEHATLNIYDYWELDFAKEKVVLDKHLKFFEKKTDSLISAIPPDIDKKPFIEEGKMIAAYIKENQFERATTVLVVLKK